MGKSGPERLPGGGDTEQGLKNHREPVVGKTEKASEAGRQCWAGSQAPTASGRNLVAGFSLCEG